MNIGYIPHGMMEKEFRWEYVNYALYYHLDRLNTNVRLRPRIEQLIEHQKSQLLLLQEMSSTRGKRLTDYPNHFEPPNKVTDLLDELEWREDQLIREYESYTSYFLDPLYNQHFLAQIISNKQNQLNLLLELKQCLPSRKDSDTRQDYFLEDGYQIQKIESGLTFPTVITFDEDGGMFVAEAGYAYGAKPGEGRILKVNQNGTNEVIARGFSGPVTGLTWFDGNFFVIEGGVGKDTSGGCGQITKLTPDGKKSVIVSGLKSCGDHFTGDIKVGPDNKLYFTVGTATNSAVVGTDNLSWIRRNPQFHDTPARDYIVYGKNFVTPNPMTSKDDIVETGAFKPFGTPNDDNEVIKGKLYANGVLYRCNLDGSNLQIYADGFRNPFGLVFSPFNGKLYVTDNGADNRGSRPINEDWDNFWEVKQNGWYGWPDFFSGLPATLPRFHVEGKPKPTYLIKNHPKLAGQPVVRFEPHTSSNKFSFSTNENFGFAGEALVGQLGGMRGQSGLKVVRVNIETGQIRDFYHNKKGLDMEDAPRRPVAAIFNPTGDALYIVDFGLMGPREQSKGTGSLWKITKSS